MNNKTMNDEMILDPLSEMTEKFSRDFLGAKVAADLDFGRGHDWMSIDNGIRSQLEFGSVCSRKEIYIPKIGEVFAHVVDAKICRVVLAKEDDDTFYHHYDEIDLTNGNKDEARLSFLKTSKEGVFKVDGFLDANRYGIYIRISPSLWAKAMKQRDIFLSSLNALNYSINTDEPFNS